MDHDIDDVIDGRYRLLEVVGQGGHGVVYRALDQETGTHVAVKYLKPEFSSDPALKARMRREASAMGTLSDTSATQVFAFSEAPDGTLYIVMEFLKGSDLETTLRRLEAQKQRLPLARLRELFRPIIDTLDAAHARGIVHRDLKPANIFVLDSDASGPPSSPSPRHESNPGHAIHDGPPAGDPTRAAGDGAPADRGAATRGCVRLLDFGLVKVMQADPLTREGAIPGSPSYIAPEVWKGRPQEIDHRIDIYSLGAVLFRALAGRVPFAGASRVDILLAAARGPRPSLHAFRPDLPPEVDAWVARALAVVPEERFQDVRALWSALEPLLDRAARAEAETDGGAIPR
ncbi:MULTISPECIES: serine/threonine-protein kinase [Sorangium]|uniref:Protein kinase n=1 Tax=Sorangium cellulosum TaxID=56 RepID=A0A4P2R3A9_SORCE|nr:MULTISPECIES: serine/threonine-protein kinase [Sorangium]AUX36473.1 protein kinase [Sorangium cellulosum]WCQ95771.1 Serine/threonine-protein kinase PknH [Sorangium sp. Soce836]